MTARSPLFGYGASLAVMMLLGAACQRTPTEADATANVISAVVNPQLAGLYIEREALIVRPGQRRVVSGDSPLRNAGYEPIPGTLLVHAAPADRQYEIPGGAALEITARTSGGDIEALLLPGPRSCVELNGESLAPCERFVLILDSFGDAYRLLPELEGISARFTDVYNTAAAPNPTANVVLLVGAGDVEEAMRRARRWPGVRSVYPYRLGHVAGGPPPRPGFEAGWPVELRAPVPGDGRIQVGVGDTVMVEYHQPDGDLLTAHVTP